MCVENEKGSAGGLTWSIFDPAVAPSSAQTQEPHVKQRRILVIEQEKTIADVLDTYFAKHNVDYLTLSANSIAAALKIVRNLDVDMIVCEHAGPGKFSGVDLVRMIRKMKLTVHVTLVTDAKFAGDRTLALSQGCSGFLVRPFSFEALCDLIYAQLQPAHGFSGRVINTRLEDVLQMFCYRRETTLVTVINGGTRGDIYINDGGIIHAQCGQIDGVEAFFDIMGWESGEFLSQMVLNAPRQTVFMDWQSLLMEGVRQKDEIRHALAPAPSEVTTRILRRCDPLPYETQDDAVKRIMIVDDSRFIRKIVYEIVQADAGITVAGYAANGQEALAKIDELKPDLILLDWDMPVMKGSTTLMHIMIRSRCPVIILSGFVGGVGANPFDLLCLGGVDFLRKPQSNWRSDGRADDLIYRIKEACRIQLCRIKRIRIPQPIKSGDMPHVPHAPAERLVTLLSATGGSTDLIRLLPSLPDDLSTAVLALHDMQPESLEAFIDYLNRRSRVSVKPVPENEPLAEGVVYIHPAQRPIEISPASRKIVIKSAPNIPIQEETGSFLSSAAQSLGAGLLVVLLCGGMAGLPRALHAVKAAGGRIIAQDPETSVDPRIALTALNEHVVDSTCSLDQIIPHIKSFAGLG